MGHEISLNRKSFNFIAHENEAVNFDTKMHLFEQELHSVIDRFLSPLQNFGIRYRVRYVH